LVRIEPAVFFGNKITFIKPRDTIHQKTSKTTDKCMEKNALDSGQGCSSIPPQAGQAVATAQSPIY